MAENSRGTNPLAESGPSAEAVRTQESKHAGSQSQERKLWEEFGKPEKPINLMPGGTYNSAGGKPQEVTFKDSLMSLSLSNFTSFYKVPCARDSLLVGIGTGFGVGGIRTVLGGFRSLWSASNWAVGSFAFASFAAYEFCQRRRVLERESMKEATDLMKEFKLKKQKEKEEAKQRQNEEAIRLAEEKRRKSWTNLSNYKFW